MYNDSDFFAFAGSILFVIVIFSTIAAVITGLIGYAVAASKGRGAAGFWLGFLLSVIGIVIAAILEPSTVERTRRSLAQNQQNPLQTVSSKAPASQHTQQARAAVAEKYPQMFASRDPESVQQIQSLITIAARNLESGLDAFPGN